MTILYTGILFFKLKQTMKLECKMLWTNFGYGMVVNKFEDCGVDGKDNE